MIAPARRRRYALKRQRDAALEALLAHPDLEPGVVRGLLASQISQHGQSGNLIVNVPRRRGEQWAYLSDRATAVVLEYLEVARLWGERKPLFPGRDEDDPLTPGGLRTLRHRLEDRD